MIKFTYRFPSLIVGFLIGSVVTIQFDRALALSEDNIIEIVKSTTVRIDGRDDKHSGSGVIIQHDGNNYLVLTNWHVVNEQGNYQLYTYDEKPHTIRSSDIKHLPGVDLAVLKFNSSTDYQTASLGDSDQLKTGAKLRIGGFPLPSPVAPRTYSYLSGDISGRLPKPVGGGYELTCNASAIQGMSGGPIFNEQGQVVGINGLGVKNDMRGAILNLVYGIPINTYKRLAKISGVKVLPQKNSKQQEKDLFNLGRDEYYRADFQGAIADLTEAIRINPNNAYAYSLRGKARDLSVSEDHKGAREDYNIAINLKINSNDANIYIGRGIARDNTGDHQGAIKDYNIAIQLNPNSSYAYYNRGNARSITGDYQGAIKDYNIAIQLNPNFSYAYYNRYKVRFITRDYAGASADINKASLLNPNCGYAEFDRGGP